MDFVTSSTSADISLDANIIVGTRRTDNFSAASKMQYMLLERQIASLEEEPEFKGMSAKDRLKAERFEGSQLHLYQPSRDHPSGCQKNWLLRP